MKNCLVCFALTVSMLASGCGDTTETAEVAPQNELEQWVAENPAPTDVDSSGIDGSVD